MSIQDTYRKLHAASAAFYQRSERLFPSGITHDGRYQPPFPLYIERSQGAYKWDADGHRLIDYWTGHGALLLGHGHPQVVAAVQEQMARGTHYGAEHELILRWGELVQRLFPSIERLRFTASGTEATMLAVRLARAFTGRQVIVRFTGHYHGWHDTLIQGFDSETAPPPGLPEGLLDATIVLPQDIGRVEQVLSSRDDIAALILEPSGASYGMVPLPDDMLRQLRRLTTAHNVLLICDEVVTGFRVAPGGMQQRTGIKADLTALAKVLAGGLPGGAVGGRADIMQHLAFGDSAWNSDRKIRHNGTFNANPLSAAAGIAALEQVASGDPITQATERCGQLITALNELFRERQLYGWAAYGDASIFHLIVGSSLNFPPGELPPSIAAAELKRGGDAQLLAQLRMGLNNCGVDLMRGRSGFLSVAHIESDIEATVEAFDATLSAIEAQQRE